jgi:predicted nuclease with RNAse H fold
MLTVGVDLAAEPARTALAVIDWEPGGASVIELIRGADDEMILAALARAGKAGLDCPLGWPGAFVAFVADHQSGHVAVPSGLTGQQWRRQLAWRVTDEAVRAETGLIPLSVAADRIGHAAMRCAGLLAQLAGQGQPVGRCGDGVVVEVYPAASLKRWGLRHRGYKQPRDAKALESLIGGLLAAAPWLDLGPYEGLCRASHDATDAVIAALTARAALKNLVTMPTERQRAAARSEGWIAVPTSDLGQLP